MISMSTRRANMVVLANIPPSTHRAWAHVSGKDPGCQQKRLLQTQTMGDGQLATRAATDLLPQRASIFPVSASAGSLLEKVGSTPMMELDRGVWCKLEGHNLSGSIKDRPMLGLLNQMMDSGELQNNSTLVLTTSGSAGRSLATLQRVLAEERGANFRTLIVAPKAYREKTVLRKLAEEEFVATSTDQPLPDAQCQMLFLDGTFLEVMQQTEELTRRNNYLVLDQHHNENCMLAHRSTAAELMVQLPDVTDVVCTTGTGATAAGLRTFLPSEVTVHSRPCMSGTIDGLSDVRRYTNYCDATKLEGYQQGFFDKEGAAEEQRRLQEEHGVSAGPSTGAAMWLAKQVKQNKPSAQIAFISACGHLLT